ncbi:MAG: hypothetical protein HKM02_08470 [Pseudomonadales bacterium]|nr:hypothetical protein [Pseudomonadales bacterium]
MNSFTSSSKVYRHYALWLLTCTGIPIAILFMVGIYLQPLFGDLTRIGFYTERDFGWQGVQRTFPQHRLNVDAQLADLQQPVDILIIGDSFSRERPEYQWQNYLIAQHPLSMLTMDINHIDIYHVLTSHNYRLHPPRLLIMESVERQLPFHLLNMAADCSAVNQTKMQPSAAMTALTLQHPPLSQSRSTSWRLININFVLKYLEHYFQYAPDPSPSVYALPLTTDRLFSSQRAHTLLVFGDDIRKPWWKNQHLSTLNCRIESLRRQVEAGGSTRFILMVAPDKLTAYAPWLASKSQHEHRQLALLSAQHPQTMPRLDLALQHAIGAGQRDVYFPDDTHWGWKGQQIAAATLIRFLDPNLQVRPLLRPTLPSSLPIKRPSTPRT